MVHLPALLGLARRSIGDAPVVLYLHENQLTYPSADGDLTYPLITWLSMAAADAVWFGSAFHRADVLDALPGFLARFPGPPHAGALDEVASRCEVVPVGVDLRPFSGQRDDRRERPLVLWNQRWEHDKAPERFVDAVVALADEGLAFDVALAGQRFRSNPGALDEARRRLGGRVVHDGFATAEAYRSLLLRSDVVVSTARHEFFGVAVVEAVAAGAFPVVPDGLAYRELFPQECRYRGDGLVDLLRRVLRERPPTADLRTAVQRFDWRAMAPRYDAGLSAVARRARSTAPRGPAATR